LYGDKPGRECDAPEGPGSSTQFQERSKIFGMMRARPFLIAIVLLASLPLAADAQAKPSEYATLLAQVKGGDTGIDYGRLRLSWMDSPEYKQAKDTSKEEDAMGAALGKKDYAEALKDAEIVLASEYVNMDAHFVAYAANKELGAEDKAEFHRTVFRGLVNSILHSGDGKSTEKAWVVINTHEEYVLFRVLGYRPGDQSLMNKDGHAYDVMKVKSVEDGTDATFYFNVDIPMKHYGV
jgi:hypothetical protein